MSAQKAINVRSKVSDLQSRLSHAAKQSLDRRFGALYDKVYREDVIAEAWRRVRSNQGAAGVDRQDFDYIENEIGVEQFLARIQGRLKSELYRPHPVLRRYIAKPGRTEKRPLGIPVIFDRVCQMALKLVIEPIFETNFLECSHGFRPGRSAHNAIRVIDRTITFKGQHTVIDADIVGFFDNIRHDLLLSLVARRISDLRVLRLIRMWLRSGVIFEDGHVEPTEMGTPQGGVISPLLSNIYLHSFDKMFQMSSIPGTLVRYCDDFVILLWRKGHKVMHQIARMLERLGLKLHSEKTKIVKAEKGFDFLGVHFRLSRAQGRASKVKWYCAKWPSDRSITRIKDKVKTVIGRRYGTDLETIIKQLNPVLRGWDNYFKRAWCNRKRIRKLDGNIRERLRIFLKRKYSDHSRGTRRVHDNLLVRLGLYQFGWSP